MKIFNIEPKFSVNNINETHESLKAEILKNYPDVFDQSKLGTVQSFEVNIKLTEDAKPVICKARPVPYALKSAAYAEIDRMVSNGTLKPVDVNEQIIEWASPVVYAAKKNGQIRLCGDFKSTINKYMIKDQYPYPTLDDILSKLNGCKIFSVIDLKDAFLQVKVSEQSRKFLVIATHRGY